MFSDAVHEMLRASLMKRPRSCTQSHKWDRHEEMLFCINIYPLSKSTRSFFFMYNIIHFKEAFSVDKHSFTVKVFFYFQYDRFSNLGQFMIIKTIVETCVCLQTVADVSLEDFSLERQGYSDWTDELMASLSKAETSD